VPALVLYAANDPFVRITAETRRKISSNPTITFVETADGGHCAFIGAPVRLPAGAGTGSNGRYHDDQHHDDRYREARYDDGYWAEHEIVKFLRRF
jgi:predicted alpha/beta-fold hydrolase